MSCLWVELHATENRSRHAGRSVSGRARGAGEGHHCCAPTWPWRA